MGIVVRFFSILGLLIACDSVFAAGAGEADLGSVVDQYKTISAQFGTVITQAALMVLGALFTIEIIWSIVQRWGNTDSRFEDISPYGVVGAVLIKNIMRAGFLYWVINGNILKLLVDGFGMIGSQSAGKTVAGPSDIFFIGVDIANGLTTGLSANMASSAFAAMTSPFAALIVGLACFFIILAFMVIAAQYAVIMVQLYFFLAIYPLLMSFGATRFGKDFAAKQFSAAIVIGIRLIAIYFVVAVAGAMGDSLQTGLSNLALDNLSPLWSSVGVAGLLAFMSLKLPSMASDLVSGTASMSAADGIGAAAAVGGVAGAVGGAVAGGMNSALTSAGNQLSNGAGGGNTPLRDAAGAMTGGGMPGVSSALSAATGGGSQTGGVNSNLSPSFASVGTPAANDGIAAAGAADTANLTQSQSNGTPGGSSSEGGSIGGAGANPSGQQYDSKSVTDAMKDIAHEEQSSGGSAHVHLGDD